MSRHIFITGASGFIGYHLACALHERGDSVCGYDNFNDYYSPQFKHKRADRLKALGIPIIEGDLADSALLAKAVDQHRTTHFVHLAAQAGVRYSLQAPEKYIDTNIHGFFQVVELLRQRPHIPLIYASSSSVYGSNKKIPFAIEDSTDYPESLYGATKKANEILGYAYHQMYGIPMTGLRFFTVYGPWGRPDMAYWTFTDAIIHGKTIDIYNQGNMQRDFTYINDIIQGTIAAIDRVKGYHLYNLGNHSPVSLLDFISILEKLLNKTVKKRFLPMQKGDVPTTFADIASSQRELGFFPTTSLEEGLSHFVAWFEQEMQQNPFSQKNLIV